MSKHLGGIIGCRDKTSSWHLNGFPGVRKNAGLIMVTVPADTVVSCTWSQWSVPLYPGRYAIGSDIGFSIGQKLSISIPIVAHHARGFEAIDMYRKQTIGRCNRPR